MSDLEQANKQTLRTTLIVAVIMFGFAYGLVKLYYIVCEAYGWNGTTKRKSLVEVKKFKVDKTRSITIVFDSNVNPALPWKFYPKLPKVDVHPGETTRVLYISKNFSSRAVTGQANFSVSPPEAARYFIKTECFCFTKQKLKAGERKEMPVQFTIDPRISKEIKIVYLSYTFFNIDKYLKK